MVEPPTYPYTAIKFIAETLQLCRRTSLQGCCAPQRVRGRENHQNLKTISIFIYDIHHGVGSTGGWENIRPHRNNRALRNTPDKKSNPKP
eukprot:8013938-Karenia_brevis.AAC.1